MVEWTEWVSVVFEVVDESGAEVNGEVFGDTVQAASALWQDDKQSLKGMSRSEATDYARTRVRVEV